jgi:succinate dehydrogenase / fumarate reductase cytochrome b subunit
MGQTGRPLSPHLGIYRWQVQMVTSILHRVTGIALAVGTLILLWGLLALATGPDAWRTFGHWSGSAIGTILLIGWTWSLAYNLCNGIRHLFQAGVLGSEIPQVVRNSWLSVIVSLLLTVVVWAWVWTGGAA